MIDIIDNVDNIDNIDPQSLSSSVRRKCAYTILWTDLSVRGMLDAMNTDCPDKCLNKSETVGKALMALARARGPGVKLPTFEELCLQFSVSRTTLERAMEPLERQGLVRRKHGSGIYVQPAISLKTVGVVFGGDIFSPGFSPFWSLLLGSVRQQAGGRDLQPRAYFDLSEGGPDCGGHVQLFEDLEACRLHGLLLCAPQKDDQEWRWLDACAVPRVSFSAAGSPWCVSFDYDAFFRLATAALAPSGCRSVALLGHGILAQRPQIASALAQAGLADVQVVDWSYETWSKIIPGAGSHEHCARALAQRLLADADRTPLPDAVISTEDTATRGLVAALQQAGLQPGRDLRIVTSENTGSPVLDPFADGLTRIAFDPADVIRAALGMLETLMAGGTPPQPAALIAPRGVGEW